jgi:hypothetical protein
MLSRQYESSRGCNYAWLKMAALHLLCFSTAASYLSMPVAEACAKKRSAHDAVRPAAPAAAAAVGCSAAAAAAAALEEHAPQAHADIAAAAAAPAPRQAATPLDAQRTRASR